MIITYILDVGSKGINVENECVDINKNGRVVVVFYCNCSIILFIDNRSKK